MSDIDSSLPGTAKRLSQRIHHFSDWITHNYKMVGWLFAAVLTFFAAGICTTIRVNESFLDAVQLRLLVLSLTLLSTTQILVAFRMLQARVHLVGWTLMAMLFYCCVILT